MGAAENKALIREYFARMQAGDSRLAELLADDVEWWVPAGSKLGGTQRGRARVLAFMGRAFELFAPEPPPRSEIETLVAEGDWVCVQFALEALSAAGQPYRNSYHFAFEVRGGRIVRVKEYVDTAYANARLVGA